MKPIIPRQDRIVLIISLAILALISTASTWMDREEPVNADLMSFPEKGWVCLDQNCYRPSESRVVAGRLGTFTPDRAWVFTYYDFVDKSFGYYAFPNVDQCGLLRDSIKQSDHYDHVSGCELVP